ncbi:MAG: sulfurtransferase TusA family protein [Clostridiales bacterium]|nr:sulfurtransferase TusA family protein [Clostridiales bacterium]
MRTTKIDARGRSCPEPVVVTKQAINALGKTDELHVLVDSNVAKENVKRLLVKEGFKIDIKVQDNDLLIVAQKE